MGWQMSMGWQTSEWTVFKNHLDLSSLDRNQCVCGGGNRTLCSRAKILYFVSGSAELGPNFNFLFGLKFLSLLQVRLG